MKATYRFMLVLGGCFAAVGAASAAVDCASKEGLAPPRILYTDIVSGPTVGGENGQGAYLSIFGVNLGHPSDLGACTKVYIGGAEVGSYKYFGLAKAQFINGNSGSTAVGLDTRMGLSGAVMQLTVQIGALGAPAAGAKLPVKVVVARGGSTQQSNVDQVFQVQPGNILYVSLTGNDSTAVKNDVTHPWRYVQQKSTSEPLTGALGAAKPGDILVMRGGTWNDLGYGGDRFLRFRKISGSAPTGASGTGPIAIMAYPGEDVIIQDQSGSSGGIHGVDGFNYPADSKWITISGLRINGGTNTNSDAAPINLQHKSDNWRVINNELYSWIESDAGRAAALSGDGTNVVVYGNHLHDITGGTMNHCLYVDGGANNFEIAYNHIHNCTGGNIIQTYDSIGMSDGSTLIKQVNIHHNRLNDGNRYGLNLSDDTDSVKVWNNLIYNTDFAAVRFNTQNPSGIYVYNNTIYNNNRTDTYGPIESDWNLLSGVVEFKNNIIYANKGHASDYISDQGSSSRTAFRFSNNLFYGLNNTTSSNFNYDSNPIGGVDTISPAFTNAAGGNFYPMAGAVVDTGSSALAFTITSDFALTTRPQGGGIDVGAYEVLSTTSPPSAPSSFKVTQ